MASLTTKDGYTGRAARWYVLFLLFLIYTMSIADRQIIGILAEDVKHGLGLTDTEIGFLAGPAISFFYAVLGIPMAYAADRVNRVRFISVCIAIWSVFTILGGRATNLLQLAATRIGVSIAEAGGTPCSVSLVADYFPPRNRATAMAIYTSASTAGIFVAYALGGYVNAHLRWRNTFLLAGIPGVLLAIVMVLTVREPVRGAMDLHADASAPQLGMWATVAHIWRIPIIRQAIIASILCNICTQSVLTWAPAFAVRTFKIGIAQVGSSMGMGIAVIGGSAMILSGLLTDRLARHGLSRALFCVSACLCLTCILMSVALLAASFPMFVIASSLGYAMIMTYPPAVWLILQNHSPIAMRATATSVMLLAIALFASMPAPLLVGMASDLLRPLVGDRSLQFALLIVPAGAIAAAMQFFVMGVSGRREENRAGSDH